MARASRLEWRSMETSVKKKAIWIVPLVLVAVAAVAVPIVVYFVKQRSAPRVVMISPVTVRAIVEPVVAEVVSSPPTPWPPQDLVPFPDLQLPDQTGETTRIADCIGRPVLLIVVAMDDAASQALAGSASVGPFGGIAASERASAARSHLGGSPAEQLKASRELIEVHLLLSNLDQQPPTEDDTAAWAEHFDMDRSAGRIVLRATAGFANPESLTMVASVMLLDREGVLIACSDASGGDVGFDQIEAMWPTVASTSGDPITAYRERIGRMLDRGEFEALESLAARLRATMPRDGSGRWYLQHFYDGLATVPPDSELSDADRYLARLREWAAAMPDTQTPHAAIIEAQLSSVWPIGDPDPPSPDHPQWPRLEETLKAAYRLASEADKLTVRDPHLYATWLRIGHALSFSRPAMMDVFSDGAAVYKQYSPLYEAMAIHFLRGSQGDPAATEVFARAAGDHIGSLERETIYAEIAWAIFRYEGDALFSDIAWSWHRVKNGFESLIDRFPRSNSYLARFTRLACAAGDAPTAARLFKSLGDRWDAEIETVWETKDLLESQREWAYANSTIVKAGPVHVAAEHGELGELVKLIASGQAIDATDVEGRTPLLTALGARQLEAFFLLVRRGADCEKPKPGGWTPLHLAVDLQLDAAVAFLLDQGVDPNPVLTESQQTPLHLAAVKGYKPIVRMLIEHDGIDLSAADASADTPFHAAVAARQLEVVTMLLGSAGLDIDRPARDGNTALHIAIADGYEDAANSLLHHGANINAKNEAGRTALHLAAERGSVSSIQLLLSQLNCEPNLMDSRDWTPLHAASDAGHVEAAEALLWDDRVAKRVDQADTHGRTALHLAARNGHLDTVKWLIKREARANARDAEGNTPLDLASDADHSDVAGFLIGQRNR